jgi:hypothetical protein
VVRLIRTFTAALLTVALGAVPLVADWCAASCEAAHSATTGEPSCHHSAVPQPRVGARPLPCGQDHHPIVVDASTVAAIGVRAAMTAPVPAINVFAPAVAVRTRSVGGSLDVASSPPLDLALGTVLRI